MSTTNSGSPAKSDAEKDDRSWAQKLWSYRKYIVVEPLVFCWILPACFQIISVQNLHLEKACLINLNYTHEICDNMLDKSLNNIDCSGFTTGDEDEDDTNVDIDALFSNFTKNLNSSIPDLTLTVCKAERETQKKVSIMNGIRAPIAAIFPIIVILFAGGWSDKKGLRKPCMMFPMIGEVLVTTAFLIFALFLETIPMEVGTILEKLLMAMTGGQTLMIMGIFSYLTAATTAEDRTFRFGIFGVFTNIISIIGTPFAGTLYKQLGYVKVFLLCDIIYIIGILYLIFFVEEIKTKPAESSETNGDTANKKNDIEKEAFEYTEGRENEVKRTTNIAPLTIEEKKSTKKKGNFCTEFFDPSLAIDCIRVFLKMRPRNGRMYLIILIIANFIFLGPIQGEIEYMYQYALITLNWNGEHFSFYSTYSQIVTTVGTFVMTSIFSKALGFSDSMIGFLSSVGTVLSRPTFAFARRSVAFYIGVTLDMFNSAKAIAIKSIISTYVGVEELGRLYSILGIADSLGGFIFPPLYSCVYRTYLDSFPGAFLLFGELFFIPTAVLFAVTYFLLKGQKKVDEEESRQKKNENENENETVENTYI